MKKFYVFEIDDESFSLRMIEEIKEAWLAENVRTVHSYEETYADWDAVKAWVGVDNVSS